MSTRIDEIADGIYRISTAIPPSAMPGGFTFNQFLVADDEPLVFHTGPRKLFSATLDAIARVLPPERIRYVAFSHFEPDECGALNEFLAVAPNAAPVCSRISAMVSMGDYADREARGLADGDRAPRGDPAGDARVHARRVVVGRRRRAASSARREPEPRLSP